MTRKIILAVLLVTFIGCGLRSDKDKGEKQSKQSNKIAKGMELLSQKKLPEAIQKFNQAIIEDPGNVNNYILLGQVYNKLGNHVGAEDVLTAAQNIEPNNGEIYFQLSQALGQQEGKMNQSMTAALLSYQNFSVGKNEEGVQKSLILIKALSEQARQVQTIQSF